jgi:hypothetical protein
MICSRIHLEIKIDLLSVLFGVRERESCDWL